MAEQRQKTVFNSSVAAGATAEVDVPVATADVVVVAWTMTNAAAVGDLGATEVRMFAPTTTLPLPSVLNVTEIGPATFTSPVVSKVQRLDVRGMNMVRLRITNAAGAARTTRVHVYTYAGN